MLWAFMVYLAWEASGWRRLTNPALAAIVAFAVYAAVNPAIVLYPGAYPWDVALMIMQRRADVVNRYAASFGAASVVQIINAQLYWWPVLPVIVLAAWACRKERWFAPLFLVALFLAGGTVLGFFQTRKVDARYGAPLELGLYFLLSVCVLTVALGAWRGSAFNGGYFDYSVAAVPPVETSAGRRWYTNKDGRPA
jgi:hypothetical protein